MFILIMVCNVQLANEVIDPAIQIIDFYCVCSNIHSASSTPVSKICPHFSCKNIMFKGNSYLPNPWTLTSELSEDGCSAVLAHRPYAYFEVTVDPEGCVDWTDPQYAMNTVSLGIISSPILMSLDNVYDLSASPFVVGGPRMRSGVTLGVGISHFMAPRIFQALSQFLHEENPMSFLNIRSTILTIEQLKDLNAAGKTLQEYFNEESHRGSACLQQFDEYKSKFKSFWNELCKDDLCESDRVSLLEFTGKTNAFPFFDSSPTLRTYPNQNPVVFYTIDGVIVTIDQSPAQLPNWVLTSAEPRIFMKTVRGVATPFSVNFKGPFKFAVSNYFREFILSDFFNLQLSNFTNNKKPFSSPVTLVSLPSSIIPINSLSTGLHEACIYWTKFMKQWLCLNIFARGLKCSSSNSLFDIEDILSDQLINLNSEKRDNLLSKFIYFFISNKGYSLSKKLCPHHLSSPQWSDQISEVQIEFANFLILNQDAHQLFENYVEVSNNYNEEAEVFEEIEEHAETDFQIFTHPTFYEVPIPEEHIFGEVVHSTQFHEKSGDLEEFHGIWEMGVQNFSSTHFSLCLCREATCSFENLPRFQIAPRSGIRSDFVGWGRVASYWGGTSQFVQLLNGGLVHKNFVMLPMFCKEIFLLDDEMNVSSNSVQIVLPTSYNSKKHSEIIRQSVRCSPTDLHSSIIPSVTNVLFMNMFRSLFCLTQLAYLVNSRLTYQFISSLSQKEKNIEKKFSFGEKLFLILEFMESKLNLVFLLVDERENPSLLRPHLIQDRFDVFAPSLYLFHPPTQEEIILSNSVSKKHRFSSEKTNLNSCQKSLFGSHHPTGFLLDSCGTIRHSEFIQLRCLDENNKANKCKLNVFKSEISEKINDKGSSKDSKELIDKFLDSVDILQDIPLEMKHYLLLHHE